MFNQPQLLKALIDSFDPAPERVLVFCRTKSRVDSIYKNLKAAGLIVDVMHAERPQKARAKALERFRSGAIQVLVATDVMSRGIDIQGIAAVINFDVPLDPEDYVHRLFPHGIYLAFLMTQVALCSRTLVLPPRPRVRCSRVQGQGVRDLVLVADMADTRNL